MEESVGKVKLDYTYYSEQNDHPDDSILDELLTIVKTQDLKDYGKAIIDHKSWPILYHLSPFRENIITWYPIDNNTKILEIGSECGAHTSALCSKAGMVHSIDSSYKACLVNAYRNKDRDNLEIKIGDYIAFLKNSTEKYDIITLIGGVPYTEDILSLLKPHLNEGGKILITVNNKIGLRYFAGYSDNGKPRFTRNALSSHIEKNGFKNYRFFYPYPDACITDVIYSDDRLPHKGELNENIRNFDKSRYVYFDEAKAYDDIIEDGDYASFSNSFLVVIGDEADERIIYAKISDSRDFRFQIITELYKSKSGISVRKVNKLPESYDWLKAIKDNEDKLKKVFHDNVKICPSALNDTYLEFDYIEGEGMDKELKKACTEGDVNSITAVLDKYYEIIRYMKTGDSFTMTEEFNNIFGDHSIPEDSESGNIVNIDLVFPNIIGSNGTDTIIDYEWVFDFPIPLEFVFWRGLNYSGEISSLDSKVKDDIYAHYGLTNEKVSTYQKMEESFQTFVYGDMVRLYDYSKVIPIKATDISHLEKSITILEQEKVLLSSSLYSIKSKLNNTESMLNKLENSRSVRLLKLLKILK